MLFVMLVALLVGVSGCTGGARATSWTGLTVVDGTVYAADLDKIAALDAATSETLWTFPEDTQNDPRGVFQATPTVGEGYVIAASQVPPYGPSQALPAALPAPMSKAAPSAVASSSSATTMAMSMR
jgi:outer membrane protein assembly factor BamB